MSGQCIAVTEPARDERMATILTDEVIMLLKPSTAIFHIAIEPVDLEGGLDYSFSGTGKISSRGSILPGTADNWLRQSKLFACCLVSCNLLAALALWETIMIMLPLLHLKAASYPVNSHTFRTNKQDFFAWSVLMQVCHEACVASLKD